MLITLKTPPISKLNITNHHSPSLSKEVEPTSQLVIPEYERRSERRNLKKRKEEAKNKIKEKPYGENDLDLTFFFLPF